MPPSWLDPERLRDEEAELASIDDPAELRLRARRALARVLCADHWNGNEPFLEVPPGLLGHLPRGVVAFRDVRQHEGARTLAELCRRAFKPYLLGDRWRESDRVKYGVDGALAEYIDQFRDVMRGMPAAELETEPLAVSLYVVGSHLHTLLSDGLEHVPPRSARAKFRAHLLARLDRFLVRHGDVVVFGVE